jgi:chemotaxis protein methyltransferase CheR
MTHTPPVTDAHVGEFERLALEATGVRLSSGARNRVPDALTRAMDAQRVTDPDRLLARLREPGVGLQLTSHIVGELTTKETYLFRDPHQFDCLADTLLPQLRASLEPIGPTLRVWSAGCATGEEAYSIAMLLANAGITQAVVLGTDLSDEAIERARTGVATEMRLAPDAQRYAPLVRRCIRDSDAGPIIAENVRLMVRFAVHNILRDPVPAGQHLILCRNVMIYMPAAEQRMLVGALWRALAPGGLLLLGEAELLHVMKHDFERAPCESAIIYRRPKST